MAEEIAEQDTIAVLMVALGTLVQLRSELTQNIDVECACFLRFLYTEIGFGREGDEDKMIEKYLDSSDSEDASHLNSDKVRSIIDSLVNLKVVEVVAGKIRIIEKVHI